MRTLLALITAVCFAWKAGPAVADDAGHGVDLSLFASYWNVEDGDDTTWGPGLGLAIPVWEGLKFDFRATWFEDAGADKIGDVALIPLDFGLSWHYTGVKAWDLYILGGGMVVFSDFDAHTALANRVDLEGDTLGGYAGAGVRYNFADNFGVFTNAYYRIGEFDIETDGPVDVSSKYRVDGFSLDLGLAYTF